MPCFHPLQAFFTVGEDGKKIVKFSNAGARLFYNDVKPVGDNNLSIPCGRCMGCRLERSRQWAVRIMHEAKLYSDNCFVTLTFNDDGLSSQCVNNSLDRNHVRLFLYRLRSRFRRGVDVVDRRTGLVKDVYKRDKIRVFYCGEYGDKLGRPHYHLCLFNMDFPDKKVFKRSKGFVYYVSDVLSLLWPYGNCMISDLTFDSAAYVARYCLKKITGDQADDHYQGRLPEFCQASLKPGIGYDWLVRYGNSDCFNLDEVVVNGHKCKPPRYYDKYLEKVNPEMYAMAKVLRSVDGQRRNERNGDATYRRLLAREKCQEARVNNLVRMLERS